MFEAIVRNLQRLFDTRLSVVLKDGVIHLAAAGHEEYETLAKQFLRALDDKTGGSRAIMLKRVVQFAPVLDNPAAPPTTQQFARALGFNSAIFAPMMRGDQVIGSISMACRKSRPFDEREVALIKAFADQAVIAIENTRLLNELRQRTHDLSESLEQQSATSEVLKVISSSPGELEPVFDALLTNAMQVCDTKFGFMYRAGDTDMKIMAHKCDVPAYLEFAQKARFTPQTVVGRVAETRQVLQVVDIAATQRYADHEPLAVAAVEIGRVRTILGVPLLKENEVKGCYPSLPTGGSSIHRQADRVSKELRGASRHRHRKHPPAQ